MDLVDLRHKAEQANYILATYGPDSLRAWLSKQDDDYLIVKAAMAMS